MKSEPLGTREDESTGLAGSRRGRTGRRRRYGVRHRLGAVARLEDLDAGDRLPSAIHDPARRSSATAGAAWGATALGCLADRDPFGRDRLMARGLNRDMIGSAQQVVGGLEPPVGAGPDRAAPESDTAGRDPAPSLGPRLDLLTGDGDDRLDLPWRRSGPRSGCFFPSAIRIAVPCCRLGPASSPSSRSWRADRVGDDPDGREPVVGHRGRRSSPGRLVPS